MTPKKVDFYVYELSDYQFYQRLVCNLVEEAYIQENNILCNPTDYDAITCTYHKFL